MFGFELLWKKCVPRRPSRWPSNRITYSPRVERLEARQMLAVTATFTAASGVLSVFGDGLDNSIEIGRVGGGSGILVNGGAVAIGGGTPTVANTALIQVFGLGGDDTLSLNESNGALPRANLYGGSGNDTVTGGSGNDLLFGQSGTDEVLGRGGFDFLFGGADDDALTGGDADDQVFGQNGNDEMIWNPGEDTDLNEGGNGADTTIINGGGGTEVFTTTANGTRVRFDRLDPAPFSIDIGTTENLVVYANGGDDVFSATGNLAALIAIAVDGGTGDDTLLGSNGVDLLIGGDDDDFIDGQQGNDVEFGGLGNDTFQWDPGDGSDIIEGQDDFDTLIFNGSAGAEIIAVSANGGRTRLTRNLGSIVMDIDGVEALNVRLLGGVDSGIVDDLTGTDVQTVDFNLAGTIGGSSGDAAVDNVIINATNGEDAVVVNGSSAGVSVAGMAAIINIINGEAANDRLTVNLLGGEDVLDASGLDATAIALTADGGDHDDVIIGGDGNDTLLGGLGDDTLFGGLGIDILDGGLGDDIEIQ